MMFLLYIYSYAHSSLTQFLRQYASLSNLQLSSLIYSPVKSSNPDPFISYSWLALYNWLSYRKMLLANTACYDASLMLFYTFSNYRFSSYKSCVSLDKKFFVLVEICDCSLLCIKIYYPFMNSIMFQSRLFILLSNFFFTAQSSSLDSIDKKA